MSDSSSLTPRLALRGIEKRYPGVRALGGVDLDIAAGEIHAVLGENGAGKSTLMHVVYGLVAPDAGTLSWQGESVMLRSPRDAMALGIGLVAQHFHLVERHTVVENLALGFPGTHAWQPTRALIPKLKAAAERYNLALDPHARVRDLSPGERQRVELIKALMQGARLLVLDEPTSVLTPVEVDALFAVLRQLVAEGASVVFVTHKLAEVEMLADRVTVLRKGLVVGRRERESGIERRDLARLMVGRDVGGAPQRDPSAPPKELGRVRLSLRDLRVEAPSRGSERAAGTTLLAIDALEVRGGEILDGTLVAGNLADVDYFWGLAEGAVELGAEPGMKINPLFDARFAAVNLDHPELGAINVVDLIMLREQQMSQSPAAFEPFTGPLRDRKGNLVYAAGQSATIGELLSMEFAVENVRGPWDGEP